MSHDERAPARPRRARLRPAIPFAPPRRANLCRRPHRGDLMPRARGAGLLAGGGGDEPGRLDAPARLRWACLAPPIIGPPLASPPERGELVRRIIKLAETPWRHPTTGEVAAPTRQDDREDVLRGT